MYIAPLVYHNGEVIENKRLPDAAASLYFLICLWMERLVNDIPSWFRCLLYPLINAVSFKGNCADLL